MLRQFTLPDEYKPTQEEELIEMGEITLSLLNEPLIKTETLNIRQRVVLAEQCLATIEGKATLVEQFQEVLGLKKTRKATSITNSLKSALASGKTTKGLESATARCSEVKGRRGYYLKITGTNPIEKEETSPKTQITEITRKIREKLAQLLTQLRTAKKRNSLPIEEPAKQEVLETIESVRQAVNDTLVVTLRGFGKTSRKLIEILLEASEKCEAVTREGIAEKMNTGGKIDVDSVEISLMLYKLNESFKRSSQTALDLKSQKDPAERKRFGYYLGLKEEIQTEAHQSEEKLPTETTKLSRDKRQILVNLIERALSQTRHRALREDTIFEALKSATRKRKQITPGYCQTVALGMYGKKYPVRNFEDKLLRMAEIPEEELGFRIVRTGEKTWEAVLSEDTQILQPLLAEIAEKEKKETEKKPDELRKRVKKGLKHLKARDANYMQKVFDALIKNYTKKQGLSLEEISEKSKYKNKQLIARWLKRIGEINEMMPNLLGFNVTEDESQRYSMLLTNDYTPREEAAFSRQTALYPIKVEGGTHFHRNVFEKIKADPRNKRKIDGAGRASEAMEILADYSEIGQAISSVLLDKYTKGKSRGSQYVEALTRLIGRLSGESRITLRQYKFRTFYLSTPKKARGLQPASQNPANPGKPAKANHGKGAARSGKFHAKPDRYYDDEYRDEEPPPTMDSLEEIGGLIRVVDIDVGSIRVEERTRPPARHETTRREEKDTCEEDEYSPKAENQPEGQSPLMEFNGRIKEIAIANLTTGEKTRADVTIKDLESIRGTVSKLNHRNQPVLMKAQQDYLSKIGIAIKRSGDGKVPDYIVTQLINIR